MKVISRHVTYIKLFPNGRKVHRAINSLQIIRMVHNVHWILERNGIFVSGQCVNQFPTLLLPAKSGRSRHASANALILEQKIFNI